MLEIVDLLGVGDLKEFLEELEILPPEGSTSSAEFLDEADLINAFTDSEISLDDKPLTIIEVGGAFVWRAIKL